MKTFTKSIGLTPLPHTTVDQGLAVSVVPARAGAYVRVSGEIDLESADGLREALMAAVAACPRQGVVALDLSDVTFCDCSGLNVLLQACQRAGCGRCSLSLVTPSRPVRRLLDLTETAALFEVRHDGRRGRAVDLRVRRRRGPTRGALT